ncbi:SDR family oxidoreductase [Alphaproteobacteria bacterium]|nr:SDR family oxidoreductase [Alphaproteobacteria bacterium]
MNIFVTGACGYKGSVLVPRLLDEGHSVTAADIMWFGNKLEDHNNLTILETDIREKNLDLDGFDTVIHLASVANDPCADLAPMLTWEVSCLATQQLMDKAARSGVKNFIYASSGSVYGVKEEEQITEDLPLDPISEYNKTKMIAERVLLSYSEQMSIQIVRPATVCGYSPRMRLDVSVNMLTMQALKNRKITVFGGKQVRPNIHIQDIIGVYIFLLKNPGIQGVFNAGFENISILDIANRVQEIIPAEIVVTESNDPRSYRMNSDKLINAGFVPKYCIDDAIKEIKNKVEEGVLQDKPEYHNLRWMQEKLVSGATSI